MLFFAEDLRLHVCACLRCFALCRLLCSYVAHYSPSTSVVIISLWFDLNCFNIENLAYTRMRLTADLCEANSDADLFNEFYNRHTTSSLMQQDRAFYLISSLFSNLFSVVSDTCSQMLVEKQAF